MASGQYYAIMRMGKIKSFAVLRAVDFHNTRQIPARTVPGAEPPIDLCELEGSLVERAKGVMKKLGVRHEKGKVLANEILLTATPEWWETANTDTKEAWIKANVKYLKDLFGPGLLSISVHGDESTPHIQAIGVPVYFEIEKKRGPKPSKPESVAKRNAEEKEARKIWRISHDKLFGGGPVGLSARQTEYHAYVEHLGLTRGKDTVGKGIKHTTLKHYAKLLREYDAHLAERAEELAEDHMVYDAAADDLMKNIEAARAHSGELDARQRRIELAEGEAAQQSAQHGRQVEELGSQRLEIEKQIKHLDERKADLDEQQVKVETERADLDHREARLAEGWADLRVERSRVDADKAAIARQAEIISTKAAQLSIIEGIETKRLSVTWPRTHTVPVVKNASVLRPDEERALNRPWVDWLRRAAVEALQRSERRKRIGQIIARVRAKLKSLRIGGSELFKREAEIGALHAAAENEKAMARHLLADATLGASKAKTQQQQASAEAAQAAASASSAKRERASIENEISATRLEIERLRPKVSELQDREGDLIARQTRLAPEIAGLEEKRLRIEDEIAVARGDLAAIQAQQTELARSRAMLERDRQAQKTANALINSALQNQIELKIEGPELQVIAELDLKGKWPERIALTELPDWLPPVIHQWNGVQHAAQTNFELRDLLETTSTNLAGIDAEAARRGEQERANLKKEGAAILQRAGVNPDDVGW